MPTTNLTRSSRAKLQRLPARRRPSRSKRPRVAETSMVALNIAVAAEPRAARILGWLRRRNDQVITLTETNGNAGTELIRRGLEEDGYSTYSAPEPGERGVLIASRLPVAEEVEPSPITLPCRARSIVFTNRARRLVLLGIYVPSRDRSPEKVARKEQFLASVLASIEALSPHQRENLILLGDYNAVARHHVPPLPGFFPYEYDFHDELTRLGLQPAHELKPWGKQPHSWIGRTGIGYLYDYAHLGLGVRPQLRSCRYLHSPRQQKLSDHAAVALRLSVD